MKLKKVTRPETLEDIFKALLPGADIKVREVSGVDIRMSNGFVLQIVQENYGVAFYIEDKPREYALVYEVAGEEHRKVFPNREARAEFSDKLPDGITRREEVESDGFGNQIIPF